MQGLQFMSVKWVAPTPPKRPLTQHFGDMKVAFGPTIHCLIYLS
jgi:hypothetical protein